MKRHKNILGIKPAWDIAVLTGLMAVIFMVGAVAKNEQIKIATADASENLEIVKAAMAPVQELNEKYTEVEKELEAYKAKYPDPTQEEIEGYIKKIFGRDASMAIAISHKECNPRNKAYPKCHNKSEIEHSVGIFQINLYNSKQWIHAGRIPGVTMEEKVLWLENPFNNALYAYWVKDTSGWFPWSTREAAIKSLEGKE